MRKSITATQAQIIERVFDEGRREIHFPEDEEMLRAVSPIFRRMLSDLEKKKVVHRLGRDHFLIASVEAFDPEESAPWPVLLDLRMKSIAPYYLSYFSALDHYGLTDHSSDQITVAVLGRSVGSGRSLRVAGHEVILGRQSREDRWFGFKTIYEGHGSYQIGLEERVLLDCLDSPEISGGPETVARAWARGVSDINIPLLIEFASQMSHTVVRRAGSMMTLLGLEEEAAPLRAHIGADKSAVGLFAIDKKAPERLSRWRVAFDIPERTVRGWLAYER